MHIQGVLESQLVELILPFIYSYGSDHQESNLQTSTSDALFKYAITKLIHDRKLPDPVGNFHKMHNILNYYLSTTTMYS